MTLELFQLLRFALIVGQMVYWFWLRPEEDWEQVVWDACLYPGKDVDEP